MAEADRLHVSVNRGALITYSGFLAGKLIVFANTVVLARLLAPEHFGLVAIGLLVLSFNEALTEAGAGAAVVWRRGPVEETAAVALALALAVGLAMTAAIFLAAPAIAGFFDDPGATPVIRVFALCLLLSSPAAVFAGLLQRRMQFGRRVIPEIARAVAKGAVGIPMALNGYGVWSLVVGQVAALAVGLVLAALLCGWRPRLSVDRRILAEMLPYIVQIAAIGLLGLAIRRLDVVIIGHRMETEALGHYTLAFTLAELAVLGLCWAASQSLFPALSRNARDRDRMRDILARGLTALVSVTVPVAIGMTVLAEPLILTVFGAKWQPAIPLVQWLAIYALVYSFSFNLGDLYKATGRPIVLTWINVATLAVAAPILLISARWGTTGIAAGQVVVAMTIGALNWVVARRLAGIGADLLFAVLRAPLLAASVSAAVCLILQGTVLRTASQPVQLLSLCLVGLVSYLILLVALVPEFRRRLSGWGRAAGALWRGHAK